MPELEKCEVSVQRFGILKLYITNMAKGAGEDQDLSNQLFKKLKRLNLSVKSSNANLASADGFQKLLSFLQFVNRDVARYNKLLYYFK